MPAPNHTLDVNNVIANEGTAVNEWLARISITARSNSHGTLPSNPRPKITPRQA
jgi:hypothetical protein